MSGAGGGAALRLQERTRKVEGGHLTLPIPSGGHDRGRGLRRSSGLTAAIGGRCRHRRISAKQVAGR